MKISSTLGAIGILGLALGLSACNGGDKDDLDDTGSGSGGESGGESGSGSGGEDDTGDAQPLDADGDGFDDTEDCDDGDAAVNPEASEVCDGVDNDCDGLVDDEDDTIDLSTGGTFFQDDDGDGYGDPDDPVEACGEGEGLVADATDCDDLDAEVFPGSPEVCDGVDNDCSGVADDIDADGDGFTDGSCGGLDCDDTDPGINPGAVDICDNGIDEDCNGVSGACGLTGTLSLADADAIWRGEAEGDRAAQGDPGVASGGDLNGDGLGDVVIGAIRNDGSASNAGAVYVIYGPASGESSLSAADAKITGIAEGDFLGRSVNGVGDTNGDGVDDLLVNALNADGGGENGGENYLLYGPLTGTISAGAADRTWHAAAASDILADVEALGDTDGDGLMDLLMGAQQNDDGGTDAGAAYIFFGSASASAAPVDLGSEGVKLEGAAGEQLGSALGAGDFDGDGFADALVGAMYADAGGTDSGSVYYFRGPLTAGATSADADTTYTGAAADDLLGNLASVASAGDMDGDGIADIVLGARVADGSSYQQGEAYLFLGPPAAGTVSVTGAYAAFRGDEDSALLGGSVDGLGDFDGDGQSDILLGASFADEGATTDGGAAYLILGPVTSGVVSMAAADAVLTAEADNDRVRIQAGGDVDGDGRSDLLVGAQLNGTAGSQAGAAYLFYGTGL